MRVSAEHAFTGLDLTDSRVTGEEHRPLDVREVQRRDLVRRENAIVLVWSGCRRRFPGERKTRQQQWVFDFRRGRPGGRCCKPANCAITRRDGRTRLPEEEAMGGQMKDAVTRRFQFERALACRRAHEHTRRIRVVS